MPEPAIRVENIGKRYRITGGDRPRSRTLREALGSAARAPFRRLNRGTTEDFWALKDVSFEVQPGEVVGIIGRNGAGKSTLLKILSRITKPTTGRIELNGRVGSLLEVGTGFHPELTGRENVYLNGSILGMSRREIRAKFDEIVAFAEVEKFLDTPVKRYSSGMYVRLAFAVAAHLEPEILIVDEVLAVGDTNFQKKCIGKMQEIGQDGRSILIVSHDMSTVSRLCTRAVMLAGGVEVANGLVREVVEEYLDSSMSLSAHWSRSPGIIVESPIAKLLSLSVTDSDGKLARTVDIRCPLYINMEYEVFSGDHVLIPNMHFYNESGDCLFVSHDWSVPYRTMPKASGVYRSTVNIPGNFLSEGLITVGAALTTYEPMQVVHFWEKSAVAFTVRDSMDGNSTRGDYAGQMPGFVRPLFEWKTVKPA